MSNDNLPWGKFYWADWSRDAGLRACSYAAKGMWMDMLCHMDASPEKGFLVVGGRAATNAEIAKIIGGERRTVERLLGELEANEVFSRDDRGAIFSRRMTRECDISRRNIANGKLGGNPQLKKNNDLSVKSVKPPVKADKEEDKIRIEKKKTPLPPKGGESENPHFAEFWKCYPRKDDKGHARKAWEKSVKTTTPEAIIAGVRSYRFNPETRFVPLPATWLNGERWLHTGELPPASPGSGQPIKNGFVSLFLREQRERESGADPPPLAIDPEANNPVLLFIKNHGGSHGS